MYCALALGVLVRISYMKLKEICKMLWLLQEIIKNPKLVPGGGAAELTVSAALKPKSSSIEGIEKAKQTLKNLRIKTSPANQEFKITGLSEKTCKDQMFTLKQRNGKIKAKAAREDEGFV